jgi:hypothetical protein
MGMLSTANNEDSRAIEVVLIKGFITAKGTTTMDIFHLRKDKVTVSVAMFTCCKVYICEFKFVFSVKLMTHASGLCLC